MDIPSLRRRASVACTVIGPALLLAATATLPWISDAGAEETLDIAASDGTATNVGDLFLFLGILLTLPAVLLVGRLLRDRAPAPALVGVVAGVAWLVGGMLTVVTNEVSVAVAGSGIPHADLAGAFDGSDAWVLGVVLAVFLLGWLTAAVAFGTGVIRSRVAPAWAGGALIAAPVVSIAANLAGVKALDVAGAALALVGFATLGRAADGRGVATPARTAETTYPRPLGDDRPAT
jgi:hypothetical protein